MIQYFENRLEAVDWIAAYARDEGHFEVLREQLMYNYAYEGTYFLDLTKDDEEVVLIDPRQR